MAAQRRPNVFVSLIIFTVGTALIYFVFRTHGWHPGVAVNDLWRQMTTAMRAVAVVGLIASAYGLGGFLSGLAPKSSS